MLWIILGGGEGWRHVLGSGIFRLRTANLTVAMMEERKKYIKILFYEDAADATVSVETSAQEKEDNEIVLRINGKPDASTRGDLSTQYLLGHLPLLARPDSRQVFVLGFGSGITAGAVLGHPIDQLTIAENCQPVLQAAKWFEPWNRGVLTNSRTRVWVEDARTILNWFRRLTTSSSANLPIRGWPASAAFSAGSFMNWRPAASGKAVSWRNGFIFTKCTMAL